MASLTFTNCAITGNAARNLGGGIYMEGGDLSLHGTAVTGNNGSSGGGGLYHNGTGGGALLPDASDVDNNTTVGSGGGIDDESTATIQGPGSFSPATAGEKYPGPFFSPNWSPWRRGRWTSACTRSGSSSALSSGSPLITPGA